MEPIKKLIDSGVLSARPLIEIFYFNFYKNKDGYGKVCTIRKRAGYDATLCKATVDFSKLIDALRPTEGVTYARFDIYLGVEGAEPPHIDEHPVAFAIISPSLYICVNNFK
mgnify:CR=1 FL=1